MSILKKLFAGITVLTVITMLAPTAGAITIDELNAQIAALTAQIAALQGTTTTTSTGTITGIPAGFTFTKFLTFGSVDPDVVYLKKALDVLVPTHAAWTGTSLYGAKVKAAVIAFQEANMATILTPIGLTKGTGNLGAATRTRLNAILASGTTGGTTGGTTVPTGAGLTVTLASDTPAAGTFIRSTASALVAQANSSFTKFVFTNGDNAEAKVTTLKLKRGGISTDSDLSNVYLYDGTTKLAEYNSFSSQIITFTNAAGLFAIPAGGSKVITVKGDISGSTTATVASINLGINASTDVISNASAVNGTFPLTGNNMGVALVSDLGYFNIANTDTNYLATVDPGVTHANLFWFNIQANTQDMQIEKLVMTVVGTISNTDIQNIKLEIGGVAISETAQLASDKTITFDFSANPYKITKGQTKTVYVTGDVPTGTGRTFKFTIRKSGDLITKDVQYGVYTTPLYKTAAFSIVDPNAGGTGTLINNGTITASVATDSPSGNVAQGATNVTLAKFALKANGEAIKVTEVDVKVTSSNSEDPDNGKLYYNGSQVGSTDPVVTHSATVPFTFNSVIIGAGETGIFEYRADMTYGAGANNLTAAKTIRADNVGATTVATGQVSLATITVADVTGRTLNIASGALSAAKNNSLADYSISHPTGVKGATSLKVGSFVITAGAGEGVTITQIVVGDKISVGGHFGDYFQNLKLMNGTTQIGTAQGTLSGADGADFTFSLSPAITLAAGQQYVVDAYADILSSASTAFTTVPAVVGLEAVSVSATGITTNASANWSNGADLQTLYIATSGSLTIATVASPTTPVAGQLVMGSSDDIIGVFSFAAGVAEPVQITNIVIKDTTSYGGSINNVKLLSAGAGTGSQVQIGQTVSSLSAETDGTATFSLTTPWVIPADTTYYLVLKAGINQMPNAVSGASHVFNIASLATDVTAYGVGSGATITAYNSVGGDSVTANEQDVYRTKVTVAKTASSPSGASTAGANSDVLKFDVTVNSNYTGAFGMVGLTVNGSVDMTGSSNAYLYDYADLSTPLATETYTTCVATTTGSTTTFKAETGVCTGIPVGATVRVLDSDGTTYNGTTKVNSIVDDGTYVTITFNSAVTSTATDDTVVYRPLQPGTGKLFFGAQTTLTGDVATSSANLTVSSTAGFSKGDTITLKGFNAAGVLQENTATIKSISSATAIVLTAVAPVAIDHDYLSTQANALLNKTVSDAIIWEGNYSTRPDGSINDQLTFGTTITYVVKGDTTGGTTNETLRADIVSTSDFVWADSLTGAITTYTQSFPVTGGTLTY